MPLQRTDVCQIVAQLLAPLKPRRSRNDPFADPLSQPQPQAVGATAIAQGGESLSTDADHIQGSALAPGDLAEWLDTFTPLDLLELTWAPE